MGIPDNPEIKRWDFGIITTSFVPASSVGRVSSSSSCSTVDICKARLRAVAAPNEVEGSDLWASFAGIPFAYELIRGSRVTIHNCTAIFSL